jgi:3-oxoacyl-[acyl-carrier-protein] synthase III
MQKRQVRILGTGKYMPGRIVTDEEMDEWLGVPKGWVRRKTEVTSRHYADGETASSMGARAAYAALEAAGLEFKDIDCLVSTSGTKEQALPCMGALIQRAMGQDNSGIPAFDIDSTCLSFLTGLDVMSYMVAAGRYDRVLLVSSEIASIGLNWANKESAALFGDGAAAVVIGRTPEGESSRILHASIRTYSKGAALSEIRGGGTRLHPREHRKDNEADFLFHMDGPGIYKMAAKLLPGFVDDLFAPLGMRMKDVHTVIPHQGSAMAMRLIERKLGIAPTQMMVITPNHGNTIAASIPMGLHEAIVRGTIRRGDRVLLLGTAAGLTLGGLLLDY